MKTLKITLSILIVIATLFTLISCGAAKTNTDDTSNEEKTPVDNWFESEDYKNYDHSKYLADNGFFKDVVAKDYVTLCDYKNIVVPKDRTAITDEQIDEYINTNIMSQYEKSVQLTDRAVADGDTLNIDYVGKVDGQEFSGGSTQGQGTEVTIGVTSYIDDFLEQLIGHMPGETFDIEVTFPEQYDDGGENSLNGKDAVFTVTINHILVDPELNDEFVADKLASSTECTTVSQLRDYAKSTLLETAKRNYVDEYITTNSIIKQTPEAAYHFQVDEMLVYYVGYADYYSISLEDFVKQTLGMESVSALVEKYQNDNKEAANYSLTIQAIAEDMGLDITEQDIIDYFEKNMNTTDVTSYVEQYGKGYLAFVVINETVLDHLHEFVTFEDSTID